MKQLVVDHTLDNQSKAPQIIAIVSVFTVLTTLLVCLRVVTRVWIVHAFGPDDWMVVVAQILGIAAAVTIGLEQHFGLGRHVWLVQDLAPYMKSFVASMLIYNAALILVKMSIVLMYRRIFLGKWFQRAALVALGVLAAWCVALLVSLSLLCIPLEAFWDHSVHGRCIDFVPAFLAPAAIHMVTDIVIFAMPLPAIRQLHLPTRQKAILVFIFGLGLFTCAISIVRLSTLGTAATSPDSTWDNTEAALWSYLELAVAVIAACLPTLRPLAGRYFPQLLASTMSTSAVFTAQSGLETDGGGRRNRTWTSRTRSGSGPSDDTTTTALSRTYNNKMASGSTEALYPDTEVTVAMEPLTPRSLEGYRETVARRGGQHQTVIEANAAKTGEASGILATTTIRQEVWHQEGKQ